MAITCYTLKQNNDTEELHLFKGHITSPAPKVKCTSAQWSECGRMNKDDSSGNKFACEEEEAARKKCANLGRAVCGTCVSTLYTTYR